jgi:uncharacterized protein (TIGR00297 family)
MSIEFIILELIIVMIFFGSIKTKILTVGGAFAAVLVGTLISLCGFEYFVILAAFFFSSSKATNIHKQIKTKLLGKSYLKDKKRNAIQVFSKSLFPSLICLILYKYYGKGMHLFNLENMTNYKFKLFLDSLFIGFFESANADTWASELGISSNNLPVLILHGFKTVPKGINGAISSYGTICSIQGGLFISFIVIICNVCRYGIFQIFKIDIKILFIMIKIFFIGGVIGFIGSLIDSLLGQTVQLSIYNETKKCVIEKENELEAKKNGDELKYYGRDILNNSGVNLVTGVITSLISGYITTKII